MKHNKSKTVLTTNIYRGIVSFLSAYIETHKNIEKHYRDVGGRMLMEYLTESVVLSRHVYDTSDVKNKYEKAIILSNKLKDCEVLLATLSDVHAIPLKTAGHLSGLMGELMLQVDNWMASIEKTIEK